MQHPARRGPGRDTRLAGGPPTELADRRTRRPGDAATGTAGPGVGLWLSHLLQQMEFGIDRVSRSNQEPGAAADHRLRRPPPALPDAFGPGRPAAGTAGP